MAVPEDGKKMIQNTGLGEDVQGDNSSPVFWILGAFSLLSFLVYIKKPKKVVIKKLSKKAQMIKRFDEASRVRVKRSKILAKKDEQRLFGDLF